MDHEARLDKLDTDIRDLIKTTTRIDERLKTIQEVLPKIKTDIVEQCKNEIKTLGWKSITTIVTALVTSLSALVLHFLGKQ